jgi:uncharacterized protein
MECRSAGFSNQQPTLITVFYSSIETNCPKQCERRPLQLSRRTFLKTTAAAAAASHPLAYALPSAPREPLRQLDYTEVQLTSGPFFEQYTALHAHYLSLSNDRLLRVYRQRAGIPAPGEDMGGWYDLNGFVPGHALGQYISGLARIGATTGDPACHAKVHELVSGFAETLGAGNVSILRPETNLWICYIADKHFAGLIDAGRLSSVAAAPTLLNRVFDGVRPLLPAKGRDRIGKKDPPYDETFIMPENLFTAAEMTNNPGFTDYAHRYLLDRELFDPLARGNDPFPGQHAYSHAIALSSAGKAYLTLGDQKYRDAMANAFQLLTTTQQFASGGWGPNETFITPHRGELHASLTTTVDHFETPCGSYAATRLARYLLRTGTPRDTSHADNLERVLFNTILAVKSPDSDGDYPYYSTYSPSAEKVYYKAKWPCCSGTLVQTVADYPLNIAFAASDGFYITLYTPSRLRTTFNGTPVELIQETTYPNEDHIAITINPTHPTVFTLYLRIPAWLTQPATIRVNGRIASIAAQAGTFAALHLQWKRGDKVELILPQDFRTEPIDDMHPHTVALMRGPVQYVALNLRHDDTGNILPSSLKPAGAQTFVDEQQRVHIPLYRITNERYTTYFDRT